MPALVGVRDVTVSVLVLLAEVLPDSNAHQGSGEDIGHGTGVKHLRARPEMTASWFPSWLSGMLRR